MNLEQMLEQLGIAEIPLITADYEIKILKETENEIAGEFKSSNYNFEFQYFLNGELFIDKKNRRLDFLKDVIKVLCLDGESKIKLLDDSSKYADVLVYDEYWKVREAVAKQGFELDILMHDKWPDIRAIVAGQGAHLDELIDDPDYNVRIAVAKQGYGLERLIDDSHPSVKIAVAEQGYGLERLVNDENWYVRSEARKATSKFNINLDYDRNVLEWQEPFDLDYEDFDNLLHFDATQHTESEIVSLLKKIFKS